MSRARNTAIDLVKLLNDSSAPLYVLDDERRIMYCNAACAHWMGVTADEIVGQQCNYGAPLGQAPHAGVGREGIAIGLCPPPPVFSGQAQWAVVSRTLRSGEIAYRRGYFWPLGDGQDDSAAVIALLEPHDCPGEATSAADDDSRLHEELARFRGLMQTRFALPGLIGTSPAITRARAQLELAAGNHANVLIFGPSGSGKEHAAKAIHYAAATVGPLLPLDCAVLEANLLRSALRTAALRNSASRESAGTLLISDIDRMPEDAQSDLAELLRTSALRMRVIATSTRLSTEAVAARLLSHELACRLSTITIELPALVQRSEDLPLLAQAFLEEINALGKKQVAGFSPQALDRLAAYPWPGNLDELRALAIESHDRARGGEVGVDDLPRQIQFAADAAAHPPRHDDAIVLEEFLSRVETELITRAMRRAKGNKSKAAKLLGLTRPRLYRRLVQLGLEQPDFREEPS